MSIYLFPMPETKKEEKKSGTQIKLKKGDTIEILIETAKRLVNEKLGKYKDTSKCVFFENDLVSFFDNTPDGSPIGIDTETTRFKYIYR